MTKEVVSMFERIVQEWNQWAASIKGARLLSLWATDDDALRGWTVAELRNPLFSPRTDAMQAALVGRAQRGERWAVLTLITQLRPGLSRLARWAAKSDYRFGSSSEAADEVLAVFGEVLMGHNLTRRPDSIAANLVLDTRQRIWRAGKRQARITRAAIAAAHTASSDGSTYRPEEMALELDVLSSVGSALGALTGTLSSRQLTAELAYRAWILEESCTTIASDLGLGNEAVRTRLCRLRSAVRDLQPIVA